MSKGRRTVNKDGKQLVAKGGKRDLTSDDNSKGTCCCCKPYLLDSFTTSNSQTWNLSGHQGNGVGKPKRYWRLTSNYSSYVPTKRGCVDENGKLVGLPSSISPTSYKYTWVFRLEIGCKRDDGTIEFPSGTESASLYNC